jgi:hypothetical protein
VDYYFLFRQAQRPGRFFDPFQGLRRRFSHIRSYLIGALHRVKGRKRHLLVGTQGLVLKVKVHEAGLHDCWQSANMGHFFNEENWLGKKSF